MDRVRWQLGCSDFLQQEARSRNPGVTVAVLDTGVAFHPDLEGRILAFRDFVQGRSAMYDDSGHGTHVCGCIGGNGRASAGRYRGIAPDCYLCVGKVLDEKGEGRIESMYRGLEWVLYNQLRYRIQVLNISVGLGQNGDEEKMEELIAALDRVWESGIVVVCAAGNNGPEEDSISPLGKGREIITVGCHEGGYFGRRKNLCENYSGRGSRRLPYRKPDVVAPGTDILSCNAFWSRMGNHYQNPYVSKSGTSMATPIVSGAAALLLQYEGKMNNEEVRRRMIFGARDLGDDWRKQGWGMIDVGRMCMERSIFRKE